MKNVFCHVTINQQTHTFRICYQNKVSSRVHILSRILQVFDILEASVLFPRWGKWGAFFPSYLLHYSHGTLGIIEFRTYLSHLHSVLWELLQLLLSLGPKLGIKSGDSREIMRLLFSLDDSRKTGKQHMGSVL